MKIEEIIKLYENRTPTEQIAKMSGLGRTTIYRIIHKHSKARTISEAAQKVNENQLKEILKSFDAKVSIRKLAKQYNYSTCGMSLLLKRNNRKVLRPQDVVQRDWSFIQTTNDLFLYWLGWVLTDGCIKYIRKENRDRGVVVDVSAHKRDKYILEFFRDIIQPTSKFSEHNNCIKLYITIDRLSAQLLHEWGLVPRKSLILKPTPRLNNLTDQEFCQLLCGAIEGDGSIDARTLKSKRHQYRMLRIRICSASSQFIGWIRQRLYQLGFKKRKITGNNAKDSKYDYAISGKDAIRLSKLLLNCKYHLLKRKWDRCNEFLN